MRENVCWPTTYLDLAAVAALTVPPRLAVAVEAVAGLAGDADLRAADGHERAHPLLVAERDGAGEDDLGASGKIG